MAEALLKAHRDRWTPRDELHLGILHRVDFLYRAALVRAGNEDPGAVDFTRPGEPQRRPKWRQAAARLLGG